MKTTIDVNKLIGDINQKLPLEQQIRKDDPMYSAIILNSAVIDTYVQHLQLNLDEMLHQLTIAAEQQVKKSAAIAENMTFHGGDNIEKQLDTAAQRWEERLRKASEETEANIRRASRLAWVGAVLLSITACTYIGTWLGNTIFDITHPQKSAQQQNAKSNRLKQSRN